MTLEEQAVAHRALVRSEGDRCRLPPRPARKDRPRDPAIPARGDPCRPDDQRRPPRAARETVVQYEAGPDHLAVRRQAAGGFWPGTSIKAISGFLASFEEIGLVSDIYERPEGFDFQEWMAESLGIWREEPFDVEWRFLPEVAMRARHIGTIRSGKWNGWKVGL